MSRAIVNIDRNLNACRDRLKIEPDPMKRLMIEDLIDGLLAERTEAKPHCSLCDGKGKALPNGVECARCDRRRCMYRAVPSDDPCTVYIEDVTAKRCPKGHLLP